MIRKGNRLEARIEGAPQGYVQSFDFLGAGVSVVINGNVATVTIPGGSGGGDAYAPGSYTIATGKFRNAVKQQQFTGTQRLTIQGTGRLSIQN